MATTFFMCVLLAATATPIIAGPVPRNVRRQLFASYANTSISSSITESLPTPASTIHISSPFSTYQIVDADTALVIEPIQQTVFTHIIPAITFLNPDGEPLATEDPQTVLSTSYITPTVAPTPPNASNTAPESSVISTPDPTPVRSSTPTASSDSAPAAITSSIAAVENGTASETSRSVPMFTYSPAEETGASSIISTASRTSDSSTHASGALPGFSHPGSPSRTMSVTSTVTNVTATGKQSYSLSIIHATSPTVSEPSGVPAISSSSMNSSLATNSSPAPTLQMPESASRILVTKTEYTTIYGAPSSSDGVEITSQTPSLSSAAPTEAQNTLSALQTSSKGAAVTTASLEHQESATQALSSLSSAIVPLPNTSLGPPPLVIVTQYTTVMPSPEPTKTPGQLSSSPMLVSAPSAPVLSSPQAGPSTPAAAPPPPATSSAPPTTVTMPSSSTPESSLSPTSAPQTDVSASSSVSSSKGVSVPTAVPSASAPVSTPTSTSDGPLIITPIPPSQIFTITVTATEKETVKETTTVTVTA